MIVEFDQPDKDHPVGVNTERVLTVVPSNENGNCRILLDDKVFVVVSGSFKAVLSALNRPSMP